MKKIILILTLLLTSIYAEIGCKTDVYFANGIDTTKRSGK